MKNLDAIVVGAGPAGASAAAILGKANRRVLLIDRGQFPRAKTCGDGLTHKCLSHLQELGALDTFLSHVEVEIFGYSLFFSNGMEVTMRNCADERQPFAYIMPRYIFDNILVENALRYSSLSFLPKTRVSHLIYEDSQVVGVQAHSNNETHTFRAPLIIDAAGANSPLAVQAGEGNRDPYKCAIALRGYFENVQHLSNTIELYFDPIILPGYFWIFPTSSSTANVGCGTFQHIIQQRGLNLRSVLNEFMKTHAVARTKMANAKPVGELVGGKIPLPIDKNSNVRDGLLLVGDSAAFVDPLTAEGISFSMHSGIEAAKTAIKALDQNDISASGLHAFDSWRKAEYTSRFSKSIFFQESLPEGYLQNLIHARLEESGSTQKAAEDRGYQYELAVKIKAMLRAL
ncbi:MAG: geranylgeranyl reductase family protein [Myxococcales bacterium]|nr:geranylgeranyl reductase family protein [Myxococcales bacterium]